MAVYHFPDRDPEAQWVAHLNYLGQLCDEQSEYEGLFERLPGRRPKPSKELRHLMAQWRKLARLTSDNIVTDR